MTAVGAAVSLASAILSAFFAATVARQFLERRKLHQAMWTVGLLMFAVVAIVQLIAELSGWSDGLFRTWYVLGAGGLVGFLGAGSVYVVHRKLGHAFAAYTIVVFAAFLALAAVTPTNPDAIAAWSANDAPVSGAGWAASGPRVLSPLLNVPGAAALIGIALLGLLRYRLTYNAWIAGGAAVLAVGTALSRFNVPSLIYGAELAGIALMFVGFFQAIEWAKEHRQIQKMAEAAESKSSEATPSAPETQAKAK